MNHISIDLQQADNIVETTFPYNIYISLQRAKKIVEMTHISIALQRSDNIV